jgi:uncharacterized 2Fe-2S/4Fe-4S cluster protein (DUF4445 family)
MVAIEFQPVGKRINVDKELTLLQAAQLAGVKIRSVCAGAGTCGKCKVVVDEGEVTEISDSYKSLLTPDEIAGGYHLACQTKAMSDVRVTVPPESRIEGQQILVKASLSKIEVNPPCTKIYLKEDFSKLRDKSTRIDRFSDVVKNTFGYNLRLSDSTLQKLEALPNEAADRLALTVCKCGSECEVVNIHVGDLHLRNYGLALDIGTTKIVAYLVNLMDGEIVDVESSYNEQLMYGEDLLSRINYAFSEKRGLYKLQRASVNTINRIVEALCTRNKINPQEIVSLSVSGNTVMTYLFAGLDPSHLVNANVRVSRDPIQRRAEKFGITFNKDACVYCLPNVSRFVGGDAVADVLASGLHESPEISILIDMGTNGEIIIGSKGWFLSTSCAAGPAFEGWEIRFGMRSVEGAIDHVKIDPKTLKSTYTVIGGEHQKARGICGSGIIDAIAEMFKCDIIDWTGKICIDKKTSLIRKGIEDELEYVISPSQDNDLKKDIVITQKDINNLLDSKAAVCGAIAVLMKKVGATIWDIKNLYLAGAFGNYVDPKNATIIGIFPEFPNAKFTQMGNGSVAGAYLALISLKKRSEAEKIAETMTYYDLTVDPDFMDEYEAALYIPGKPEFFPSVEK